MTDQTEIDDTDALEVAPVETTEAPKPEWTDEDVQEAKAFGWKSPDEWAGDKPDGYIDDPRRYLDRAEKFRPFKVLRERTEKMEAEYQARFQKLEAVAAKTIEAQKSQYERDMAALTRAQLEAVDTADRERFDAIEKQKAAMMRPPELPAPIKQEPRRPPEVEEYAKTNDWLNNPILVDAGAKIIDAMGYAGRPVREQLELAEREVRKLYPGAFAAPVATAPARATPMVNRVDGGGLGGGAKGGAFAALPAEAKSTFKRFVSEGGWGFKDTAEDRERYANDYNS
jgi:hypothetical protein